MAEHGAIDTNVKQDKPADEMLSDWIQCICVVTFDLEFGQAMELVYPSNVKLSEEDKTNLCYLAFPDSNSGCMGDTQFHVKIKCSQPSNLSQRHINYNAKCPVFLQADHRCLYGFVFFRQIKDLSLPRGYFQKSVIILSQLPFISLFTEVCGTIAPEYFKHGITGIEVAWHDIKQWPDLYAGETVSLPLLGIVLQAQLICDNNKICSSSNSMVPDYQLPVVVSSLYELNTFGCFSSIVSQMHLLWELVLTTEPIVVMASSPTYSSQVVQALVSLIVPLAYYGDYRPYFTIHDNEFKEYMSKTLNPPPIILGVTNPYFTKTLQHWPHIVRVTDTLKKDTTNKSKLRKGSNLKILDAKPGVYTEYKPFLYKDKSIVKKLIRGMQNKRPEEVQSALLRRHFLELTQSFMIPLERYMSSLMPLQRNISPFKAAPKPWPFNPDNFLASLEYAGPQLTCGIKGDWKGLYKQFFRSPNFNGWYNIRYKGMMMKLQVLQIEALSSVDINNWLEGKQEVEIVDMILKIRQKLDECESKGYPLNKRIKDQLKVKMDDIICSLPDDLKNVLSNKKPSSR
ncbi:protein DENND6B [Acyrthosiphon pisum]|uniref:UDENN domain-containing protein n=1 Tax=Acyrthosiphon pisum TaxID=7029 RepID=A0A8R2A1Q5_ACYPI|nr:protein DENND6B [Acyrthosiphon pisum]|eukprot:XP_001947112.2 PREDICTED: protein DENND6B [Acyrthosiphon pisum]